MPNTRFGSGVLQEKNLAPDHAKGDRYRCRRIAICQPVAAADLDGPVLHSYVRVYLGGHQHERMKRSFFCGHANFGGNPVHFTEGYHVFVNLGVH